MRFSKLFLALILSIGVFTSNAQLTVGDSLTVTQLVNDVLLGEGVTASNITYNGMTGDSIHVQAGTFNSDNSNLAINEGVIMASGNINVAIGPNNLGTASDQSGYTETEGDQDLADVVGNESINDVAIIEFDFTASSDSLKFNYSFASEEYNDFTCCNVNDVFGFFLSGPGINGPYSNNAENIALIPETDIPVSINTVNNGVGSCAETNCSDLDPNWQENSIYFNDNENNSEPNSTQFVGFTVSLAALADIECGATYHIKLAIADVGDDVWDSAVFLEAGSFAAFGEVFVDVDPTIGGEAVVNPQYDSVLVAGCSEASIDLIRPDGLPIDSLFVEFSGSAEEGSDYELGDNDTLFFFPEGVDTLTFNIITLYDGTDGDNEELIITIFYQDGCDSTQSASDTIPFADPYVLESETENVELFCPADMVDITAQGFNGVEPYIYSWETGDISQTIDVNVPKDEQYFDVTIGDQCSMFEGFDPIEDSVLVINSIPDPLSVNIEGFNQPTCGNEPVDLTALAENGNGEYTYIWQNSEGGVYPNNDDITVGGINSNYVLIDGNVTGFTDELDVLLTVIDTCGTMVDDSVRIEYPFYEPLEVNYPTLTDNCPENPIALNASVEGGAGENEFTWGQMPNPGNQFVISDPSMQETTAVPPGGVTTYSVLVTDRCGRQGFSPTLVTSEGNPVPTGTDIYEDSLRVIRLDPMMNVITPNSDGQNDYFIVEGIDAFDDSRVEIYDRWGKMIYKSDNYKAASPEVRPDDAFNADGFEDGTYFYIVNIDSGECVSSGTLQVLGSDN
jgi:gliding motility-associated-like protein